MLLGIPPSFNTNDFAKAGVYVEGYSNPDKLQRTL